MNKLKEAQAKKIGTAALVVGVAAVGYLAYRRLRQVEAKMDGLVELQGQHIKTTLTLMDHTARKTWTTPS